MPEIRPVKKAPTPKYPTKYEALRRPDILRNIPKRWQNNPVVCAALGMTLFLTTSACGARNGSVEASSPAPGSSGSAAPPSVTDQLTASPAAVAPIFTHGGGQGSFGCESVVAPYIFTEDEALELIISEARSYGGLELSTDSVPTAENLTVDWVDLYGQDERVLKKAGDNVVDIIFDAATADGSVAVEFVSHKDMADMSIPEEYLDMMSSVESYDYKSQAESVRGALDKAAPAYTTGVFYDPYSYQDVESAISEYTESFGEPGEDTDWEAYYDGMEDVSREVCEENLRAQVRDFIDWLKAQGII